MNKKKNKDIENKADRLEAFLDRIQSVPYYLAILGGIGMVVFGFVSAILGDPGYNYLVIDGMAFITVGLIGKIMIWTSSRIGKSITEEVRNTRNELKTSIGDLRTEIKTSIDELGTEIKTSIDELKTEVKTGMGELKTSVDELKTTNESIVLILERIEKKLPDANAGRTS